jgi:type IV pilus assembly protein PilV
MNLLAQRSRARGFTLLEVLISILVVAFGLLGIAGLQAFALKNNQSASYRTVATALANDIIDRIHANPLGADQGHYNKSAIADYETGAGIDCSGMCTPEQLASRDRYEWEQLVKTALPGGVGIVCVDGLPADAATTAAPSCDPGKPYAVKIWWADERSTGNPLTGLFTTQFAK